MVEKRKIITVDPENSETPLEDVCSWVTPNRLFFVRDHFAVPSIELDKWRLTIEGCVERTSEWTWDDLKDLPVRSVFATVECAGNGRSFLQPSVHGVQWGAGAIGHAEWTGVPLHLLLDKAGVQREACEVVFYGADAGTEADHPERMHFARGLPLEMALHPDTLVAYRMNGEPLEPDHGFPVRLFVPGWYGVASVKWLTRIELIREPFRGYFQTKKYTYQRNTSQGRQTAVVGPIVVKSEIIRPRPGELLGLGKNQLFGVAWAGEDSIAAVEISLDGGDSWNQAQLIGPRDRYSWCLWEYLWKVNSPGMYHIVARAVASNGEVQPQQHDPLRGGYMINFWRPVALQIEATRTRDDQRSDADTLLYDMNAFAEEKRRLPLDVEMEYTAGAGI